MQSVNSWLSIQIPFASTALIRAEPIRFAGRRLNAPVSQGSARLLTNNTATCLIMVRLAIRFGQSIPAIRVSFRLRLVSSHGLPTVSPAWSGHLPSHTCQSESKCRLLFPLVPSRQVTPSQVTPCRAMAYPVKIRSRNGVIANSRVPLNTLRRSDL